MSSLSQAQVNRMTNAEYKAFQAAAIARVNAEFGISDSVPPVANKSGGALLDGSGVAVAAGGAPLTGFEPRFFVRAFVVLHGRVCRFEKQFIDLPRAEKFKYWMLVNTDHQDIRIENERGQVVSF